MPDLNPLLLKQFRQQIADAVSESNWGALSSIDLKLRTVLKACQTATNRSHLKNELKLLQLEHQRAIQALAVAQNNLKVQIESSQDEKERFEAYKLALYTA